jgi:sugar lactone lactonase YvrE
MTRFLLGMVGIALALAATILAQGPPPASVAAPPALWTITADLAAPESAYYHAASQSIFVSNINGPILEKNGLGYISRIRPDGTVVDMKWVTGLNAPKGLRSVGGTLWVSDIDEVVAIDIAGGRITSRVRVEGAQFLNDLATSPDGTVYVSDSQLARIYAVKDGRASVFAEGAEAIEQPNGVLVDGNRLIVGSIGPGGTGGGRGRGAGPPAGGRLFAFDLTTKARTILTPEPVGGIDGIEPDGSGGYLITDVFGSRLVHITPQGTARTLLTFPAAGADFGYIPDRRIAVVPFLFGNSVAAYDLSGLLP